MIEADNYEIIFDTICSIVTNFFTSKSRIKSINDKTMSIARENVGKFATIKSESFVYKEPAHDHADQHPHDLFFSHLFLRGGDSCLILDVTFDKTEEFVIPQYKILTSNGEFYIWEYNVVIDT